MKMSFSEDRVNQQREKRENHAPHHSRLLAIQEDSHYKTGFLSYSHAYNRLICSCI